MIAFQDAGNGFQLRLISLGSSDAVLGNHPNMKISVHTFILATLFLLLLGKIVQELSHFAAVGQNFLIDRVDLGLGPAEPLERRQSRGRSRRRRRRAWHRFVQSTTHVNNHFLTLCILTDNFSVVYKLARVT